MHAAPLLPFDIPLTGRLAPQAAPGSRRRSPRTPAARSPSRASASASTRRCVRTQPARTPLPCGQLQASKEACLSGQAGVYTNRYAPTRQSARRPRQSATDPGRLGAGLRRRLRACRLCGGRQAVAELRARPAAAAPVARGRRGLCPGGRARARASSCLEACLSLSRGSCQVARVGASRRAPCPARSRRAARAAPVRARRQVRRPHLPQPGHHRHRVQLGLRVRRRRGLRPGGCSSSRLRPCTCPDMGVRLLTLRARRADTREQLWNRSLTIGRVVTAVDIPAVPSRPGGPCTDIAPYYGAAPPRRATPPRRGPS